jgi:hypothetical protein
MADMKTVFLAVLRLCREAGLVKLGLVALDGTKVQGNASLEANRTAASIEAEIEKMLAEAEATDAKEDSQSATQQGAALPKALARRAERLARLRKCKEKLERRAAAAAARQQAKIDATEAEEQAAGRRKRAASRRPPIPALIPAIVYIRQSTVQQVERHKESTRLQYALVDRAFQLGWAHGPHKRVGRPVPAMPAAFFPRIEK